MTFSKKRTAISVCTVLTVSACAPAQEGHEFDRNAEVEAVSAVLDQFHQHASNANGEAYFSLFAPNAVFHGTDVTERWTITQFREYASARFDAGNGWTYVLAEGSRNVDLDPTGQVAWFDEVLENENYGTTRGTGVMRKVDGAWKIAQYHLTIPVPNDLARDVVDMIRSLEDSN